MIVPQFLRFYQGYNRQSVLDEYAKSFFALVNSMYRIQSSEKIDRIHEVSIGMADDTSRNSAIEKLEKGSAGLHGILKEVKSVENVRKK